MHTQNHLTSIQTEELKASAVTILANANALRGHKHVVRAFVAEVYRVTGIVHSVATYRKLFTYFFPDRSPSTDTFAAEKRALLARVDQQAAAAAFVSVNKGVELTAIVERAVVKGLGAYFPVIDAGAQIVDAQKIIDFFQDELTRKEKYCRELQDQIVSLQSKLQAAAHLARQHQDQQHTHAAQLEAETQNVKRLLIEIDGQRRFNMQAIDAVRAETRQWKERYENMIIKNREDKQLLEHFRRLAYQRGAPIPDQLLDGVTE